MIALKEFLIREGYVIQSKTNLLNDKVYFIVFDRVKMLQEKTESALSDFEKELMNLLSLKTSVKIIDLKELLKTICLHERRCLSDNQ